MKTGVKKDFVYKNLPFSLAFLLLLLPGISASAIYKWVDENGETHYGSKRPATTQSEKLNIRIKQPVLTKKTNDGDKKSKKGSNKNESQATETETPQMSTKEKFRLCNQAKNDLQRIEARGRIRVRDKDGTARYLTPKERGQRLAASKKDINDFCR